MSSLGDRADAFWQGLQVQSQDGQIEIRNGFRYQWVRNELGRLYLKSLGQVGYHLAKTYTVQEYAQQARAMAEAHAAGLSPEIRGLVGIEVAYAGMFEMAPAPIPADMTSETGPVFL